MDILVAYFAFRCNESCCIVLSWPGVCKCSGVDAVGVTGEMRFGSILARFCLPVSFDLTAILRCSSSSPGGERRSESLAFRLRDRNQLSAPLRRSESLTASWIHFLNSANSLLHIPFSASVYFAAMHFPYSAPCSIDVSAIRCTPPGHLPARSSWRKRPGASIAVSLPGAFSLKRDRGVGRSQQELPK